jgi:hypothetical protein
MESCTLVPCGSYPGSDNRDYFIRQGTTRRSQTSGQEDRLARRIALYSRIYTAVLSPFQGKIPEAWMGDRLFVECFCIASHLGLIVFSPLRYHRPACDVHRPRCMRCGMAMVSRNKNELPPCATCQYLDSAKMSLGARLFRCCKSIVLSYDLSVI